MTKFLKYAEWVVALVLSATIIFLLIVRAMHAGGLWRDECAVVQLARMPSVSDIFHNFQHEAFPPLFPLIVRAYTILFGSTDLVLRVFGLCVGCLLIAAFWINARSLSSDVPLIALGLTSLNTTFFVWGTTIRGYGLGSAMIVLIFGCLCALVVTIRLATRRHRHPGLSLRCSGSPLQQCAVAGDRRSSRRAPSGSAAIQTGARYSRSLRRCNIFSFALCPGVFARERLEHPGPRLAHLLLTLETFRGRAGQPWI